MSNRDKLFRRKFSLSSPDKGDVLTFYRSLLCCFSNTSTKIVHRSRKEPYNCNAFPSKEVFLQKLIQVYNIFSRFS